MIGQLSQIVADCGLNIDNMSNVSRGSNAYTLLELSGPAGSEVVGRLRSLRRVRRIRTIAREA